MTNVTTHALTNFVRFGDPNGEARSFWRPVERGRQEDPSYLSFAVSCEIRSFLSVEHFSIRNCFQAPVRIRTGYSKTATDFWLNQETDST